MKMQNNILLRVLSIVGVIMVMLVLPGASGTSVTRDLPYPDTIDPSNEFEVLISVSGYGMFGQITETISPGWTYTGSSLDPEQVSVAGDAVTFTLLGETGFIYTVKAPASESACCMISGILMDEDKNLYNVGGDSQVCTGTSLAYNEYDVDKNCIIEMAELAVAIEDWKKGNIGTSELSTIIVYWKSGRYC